MNLKLIIIQHWHKLIINEKEDTYITLQCTNDNITIATLYITCVSRAAAVTREEMKANLRNALSNNYQFISVSIFFPI